MNSASPHLEVAGFEGAVDIKVAELETDDLESFDKALRQIGFRPTRDLPLQPSGAGTARVPDMQLPESQTQRTLGEP